MQSAVLRPTIPPVHRSARLVALLLVASALLGGCDMLGIDTPAKQAARREADGKAIGAGCRHTQRSLEDCYAANPKASKASIFAGWREMDEYMRENDIPAAPPAATVPPKPAEPATSTSPAEEVIAPPPAAKPAAAPAATPPTGSIVPRLAAPTPPAKP